MWPALLVLGAAGCERSASAPPESAPAPWFTEVTGQAGISFSHGAGLADDYDLARIMGSGAGFLDYDGDGRLDIYLANGERGARASGRLLHAEPDGTYRDVTDASGLDHDGFGMGVAAGDYDNDGDPDVYLANYGPDALYRNNGDGTFTDVTAESGIRNDRWACSAAFFDYDRDGRLDLFVANYVHYPQVKLCDDDAGRPEYCGPLASPPTVDVLYHNRGDGTFEDVTVAAGLGATAGRGLGVVCEDFDSDGWIDVFVANDGEPNFLWMNQGDGTFSEQATIRGAAVNAFANSAANMGIACGDIEGDGDLDLFITHLVREGNTLYRNDGSGGFDDVTAASGLGSPSLPYTGFGTAFFDFDHDGDLDVAAVNGRVKRGPIVPGAAGALAAYAEPNLLFRNDGSGLFEDVSGLAGGFCSTVEVSRGLAAGDIDGDGDIDLLVSNCHGPARLYRNDVPGKGHWLIVAAEDARVPRATAVGARIAVTAGGRTMHRTINPAYSYASSNDPRAHFGLGQADRADLIEVRWPDGAVERLGPVPADRVVTVTRSAAGPAG